MKSCTEGAIIVGDDGIPLFAPEKCIWCGDCVKVCPSDAWQAEKRGYTVYAGGKWGRSPLVGTPVATFLPGEKVVEFIAEVLAWYRENAEGLGRVRLGRIILTHGIESLLERLREKFPKHVEKSAFLPQIIKSRPASTE